MKLKNTLPQLLAVLFILIVVASCQEDFSTLGSDTIGGQPINSTLDVDKSIIAYSKKLGPVQTNQMPLYQLGTYTDPLYGKTKLELLTQLSMPVASLDPDFGFETVLDSVILYIPYLTQSTTENEVTTYSLDSVYGSDPIDISIYESNFLLRDLDPTTGLSETQKYYSDLKDTFLQNGSNLGPLIHEVENFVPSNESILLIAPDGDDDGTEPDESIVEPGFRISLPVDYFNDRIILQEDTPNLLSNSNFKNYFRGLFFEVDDNGTDGNLFLFSLASASVRLYYTYQDEDPATNPTDPERLNGIFTLAISNSLTNDQNVNFITNEVLPPAILDAVTNPNTVNGEESLYLRGGEGIGAIINLFGEDVDGNGVADELDEMRLEQWLINEANLIFYVDQAQVTGGDAEPERIIIYDAVNSKVLIDFDRDLTTGVGVDAFTNHLGRLDRGSDENGDFYKIRITHHISNLVHKDSTNVPLALMIDQNVNNAINIGGFKALKTPLELGSTSNDNDDLKTIPTAGILSHQGTVLHGNTSTNQDKRLKLQIYYTKPN